MTTIPKSSYRFVGVYFYIGLALGLIYWVFDAAIMAFIFNEGTLVQQVLAPDADEIYMRAFTWLIFTLSGAVINHLFETRTAIKQESQDMLRILENAHNEFYLFDAETTKFLIVNDRSCKSSGYSLAEFTQLTPLDLAPYETPQSFAKIIEPLIDASQQTVVFETHHRRKDGTVFPVGIHLQQATYLNRPVYVSFVLDISQRVFDAQEKQLLQSQVLRSQKLDSLANLAGGMVHDFNNLLTGAIGNAELALQKLDSKSVEHTYVNSVLAASLQGAEICKQLLAYTGKGQFMVRPINLSAAIKALLPLVRSSIPKQITLETKLQADLPVISADNQQLSQVIMNLCVNGSEAIGDREGSITISTSVVDCDSTFLESPYLDNPLPEGRYICLNIEDSGCGIAEEALLQIFDPFYSTKFTGRGMGLAALLGIVRGHHGMIKVDSAPDKGSSFRVLLPVTDQPIQNSAQPSNNTEWTGAGTALLVDDEPVVRQIAEVILESSGFTVLTAVDGRQGVEMFRDHCDEISVVILDVMMPVMGGEQAHDEIRAINDNIPIIFISGYNDSKTANLFAGRESAGFIQKPFGLDNFIDTLREHLASQSSG